MSPIRNKGSKCKTANSRVSSCCRWAGAVESSTLLASRAFNSSVLRSNEAGDGLTAGSANSGWVQSVAPGGDLLSAADNAAGAELGGMLAVPASAEGVLTAGDVVGAASSELGGVLGAAMAAVDGLHAATGLPWWATIASVGVLVRAAMLPVSLQGMKASAALMPLLRQARDELAAGMRPPLAPVPPPSAAAKPEGPKQQRWQRAQQQSAAAAAAQQHPQQQQQQQAPPPPQPGTAAILHRFHQLRRAAGAPHPVWVLASPLAQLPVFITAMATVRTMSLDGWPGFSEGGAAWFQDLTLPALDLANLTAPLGERWPCPASHAAAGAISGGPCPAASCYLQLLLSSLVALHAERPGLRRRRCSVRRKVFKRWQTGSCGCLARAADVSGPA